jgi:lactoylglutathione lyase
MTATEFNHVSIHAEDLEESAQYYEEVFGLERIQTPNLGIPLLWLRCGDRQLHLFERETEAPAYHHFSLTVDNFQEVFEIARQRELFDHEETTTAEPRLYELPDGAVQMYMRDPANNLIEVNHPEIDTLDQAVREKIVDRSKQHTQSEAQARAKLFLDAEAE